MRLTFELLVRKHFLDQRRQDDGEEMARKVFDLRKVDLGNCRIAVIENLECLGRVVTLCLQCNRIRVIQDLESLVHLRLLVLSDNHIEEIPDLRALRSLLSLDLARNRIARLAICSILLPPALAFLTLDGNPCADGTPDYRYELPGSQISLSFGLWTI